MLWFTDWSPPFRCSFAGGLCLTTCINSKLASRRRSGVPHCGPAPALHDSRSSIDIPLYEPGDLEDRYETRLRTLIDAKLKGEGIDLEEEAPQAAASNVVDLMAALKKSLGQEKLDAAPKQKKARAAGDARQQPGLKLPIKGGRTAVDEKAAAQTATKSSRKRA
jgi:hypothetical protein